MGAGGSKQEQQIFNADAPVRLSQSVLNSLQTSPETDSTRAQDLELKIQSRVNAELQKIRSSQAQKLSDLTASLTTNPPSPSASTPDAPSHSETSLAYHLSSPFYHEPNPKNPLVEKEDSGRSHDSVQKEIMDLKKKLESRKKVEKVPKEVEEAKDGLVKCLRQNDRRPLDCWKEVETFKVEVGKLEREFVSRVGR